MGLLWRLTVNNAGGTADPVMPEVKQHCRAMSQYYAFKKSSTIRFNTAVDRTTPMSLGNAKSSMPPTKRILNLKVPAKSAI
jgi:hypothetical protein